MLTRIKNRFLVFGFVVLLSSFLGTTSGMAASKPSPKPTPTPAVAPVPAPKTTPAAAPAPSPQPGPSPKPAPAPAPKPTPTSLASPQATPSPAPGLSPAPSASGSISTNLNDKSAAESARKGNVGSILESNVASQIELGIANKATNTPTIGSAVVGTIRDSGGVSQIIPNILAVTKLYGPPIIGGVLQILVSGPTS
jgi:hypothetical protein